VASVLIRLESLDARRWESLPGIKVCTCSASDLLEANRAGGQACLSGQVRRSSWLLPEHVQGVLDLASSKQLALSWSRSSGGGGAGGGRASSSRSQPSQATQDIHPDDAVQHDMVGMCLVSQMSARNMCRSLAT